MSEALDLELILNNSLKGYQTIRKELQSNNLYQKIQSAHNALMKQEPLPYGELLETSDSNEVVGGSIESQFNKAYQADVKLSERDWNLLLDLFEDENMNDIESELNKNESSTSAGVVHKGQHSKRRRFRPKHYAGKSYAQLIYFPKQSPSLPPTKDDIILCKLAAGDPELFKGLKEQNIQNNNFTTEILAGGFDIKEDEISNIEAFFEAYENNNMLLKDKLENVNRWKNIENYDELLQQPFLKDGKDFMNKFLDIKERIEAGQVVEADEVEGLVPEYMLDGEKLLEMGNELFYGGKVEAGEIVGGKEFTLVTAVDPNYSPSGYLLSRDTSDLAKALMNEAFLRCYTVLRSTVLADLKAYIRSIGETIKRINRLEKRLVETSTEEFAALAAGSKKK